MERLNQEELARLVDEQPTPAQQALLERYPDLRRELEALRAQTAALRNLPSVLPPTGSWAELERELASHGLIRRTGARRIPRGWLQAAAAVVLFLGGTAFGRAFATTPSASDVQALGEPGAASFASLDQARQAVEVAERQWVRAFGEYRRLADQQGRSRTAPDPAIRLATIEALLAASQAAVNESPADPFFNGFLVSTMAERQQALRQISQDNWH